MSISLSVPPSGVLTRADAEQSSVQLSAPRWGLSWITVAVVAIFVTYINGFWITSLEAAVGAIERTQHPVSTWLRDGTLMLPLMILAVFVALTLTRRLVGTRREIVQVATAAVLMIVLCTAVSIGEVAVNAAYNYHVQTGQQLAAAHAVHAPVAVPGATGCIGLCAVQRATLLTHIRAVGYASVVLAITNVVVVLWSLALRGGRLWGRVQAPADDAATVTA